jgi:hypothetical protein
MATITLSRVRKAPKLADLGRTVHEGVDAVLTRGIELVTLLDLLWTLDTALEFGRALFQLFELRLQSRHLCLFGSQS